METIIDPYAYLLDANGQIRREHIDDLLIEVVSGKHIFTSETYSDELFASVSPNAGDLEKARIIYRRSLHDAKVKHNLLSREELEKCAIENGVFDPQKRAEKESIVKLIENLVRSREQTTDSQQKVRLDAELVNYRDRLQNIEIGEEEILRHSAENKAEEARIDYLTSCCTFFGELLEDRVWANYAEYQNSTCYSLILDARLALIRVMQGLPVKIIRALARTSEWRVRWKAGKESNAGPFDTASTNWDKNKLNLVYWSDFYDNIMQHPERPAPDIINNDEKLQEWLNAQLQKQKSNATNVPHGVKPITYIDGSGKRKTMQFLGQQHRDVKQPFRIRTKLDGGS